MNVILNRRSPDYQLPTPESLIYVVAVSRAHILSRDVYPESPREFYGHQLTMCCGLTLMHVMPTLYTLESWEEQVRWTRDHEVPILRRSKYGYSSDPPMVPACLVCDQRFNQSEMDC